MMTILMIVFLIVALLATFTIQTARSGRNEQQS